MVQHIEILMISIAHEKFYYFINKQNASSDLQFPNTKSDLRAVKIKIIHI